MKTNIKTLAVLLGLLPLVSFAQHPHGAGCGTDVLLENVQKNNPQALKSMEDFNLYVQDYASRLAAQKTSAIDLNSQYVVPVVFHVVHTGKGQADSISVAQVRSEFDVLFNYYRQAPGTFGAGGYGRDSYIEFSLATKDPNGNPHPGVVYVRNTNLSNHDMDTEGPALKSCSVWPKEKYLNVWVVKAILSGGQPGVAGYATFPDWDEASDGVVLLYDCIGTFGATNGPKNIPSHEFGHWLSLFHPFQGACGNANCNASGDRVCDTPPIQSQQFKPVTIRLNTCNNDSPDKPDNQRNIMDYASENSRPNYFSPQQTARMRATLENTSYQRRFPLWQEDNLEATGTGKYGPPKALFWGNKTGSRRNPNDVNSGRLITCVGSPLQFYDYSHNQPHQFFWEFPGGTPATSTEQYPLVIYSAPGDYDVKLTIKNLTGTDTLFREKLVQVFDTIVSGISIQQPLTEGFESPIFPPKGWWTSNPDLGKNLGGYSWDKNLLNSGYGQSQRSAMANLYIQNDYGQKDGLVTPRIALTPEIASISFSYAYTPLDHQAPAQGGNSQSYRLLYTDTLDILLSKDCGATWSSVWRKGGIELMTTAEPYKSNAQGDGTDFFTVQNEEWRTAVISLHEFAGAEPVMIKFETTTGFGNRLYLDDVRIPSIVSERALAYEKQAKVTLAPNPAVGGRSALILDCERPGVANVEIFDVLGRLVTQYNFSHNAGKQNFELNLSDKVAGVYTAKILVNDELFTRKIQVNR